MKIKVKEYAGTVSVWTNYVDKNGKTTHSTHGRWVLYRWFGIRRAKLIGDPGTSSLTQDRNNLVKIWVKGGPLPPLEEDTKADEQSVHGLKLVWNDKNVDL